MGKDLDMTLTASELEGSSPALRAQEDVDLDGLATYVADLIRGGFLVEAWGEVNRALFHWDGNKPRGLSAASPEDVNKIKSPDTE